MTDWHDELRERGSVITLRPIAIPVLWIAFLLSISIHIAALLEWLPELRPVTADAPGTSESAPAAPPIVARLGNPVPPAEAPAVPQTPTVASPPRPQPPPPAVARPRPRAPRPPAPPAVQAPAPLPVPPPEPAPPQPTQEAREVAPEPSAPPSRPIPPPDIPPMAGDLASYIAARRRARGASDTSGSPDGLAADEIARRDRIVASNLAPVNTPTFNDGPRQSGGVFQILRVGYDDAEFAFFGWNRDIRRRAHMKIEVRRAGDEDIQHAIVRKMIAIIREYEVEDFTWESLRLGRNVRLSARLRDNAGLEDFLMHEFFEGTTPR